jgi:aryl carrier-like protein
MLAAFLLEDEQENTDAAAAAAAAESAAVQIMRVPGEIMDNLCARLPGYMVPTVFFTLSQLPMMASGKTDRKRLREIGASVSTQQLVEMRAAGGGKRAPTTDVERQHQRLWAQVLHIERESIGLDDSFFTLGGDSVTAMQLVAEARKAGIQLTAADVFRHPRLVDLASLSNRVLNGIRDVPPFSLLQPAFEDDLLSEIPSVIDDTQVEDVADVLPLTDFQETWAREGNQDPHQSVHYFFLDLGFHVDVPLLKQSCRAILRDIPILRAAFVPLLGQFWQVVLRQIPLPFRTVCVTGDLLEETHGLCSRDTETVRPNVCPTSFILLRHEIEGDRLVVRLSHAQYDGTCMPLILRQFANAYEQKHSSPYGTFSRYMAHTVLQKPSSIAFWKTLLEHSRITRLTPRLAPKLNPDGPARKIQVESLLSVPQLPNNITAATLVSSAWAMLLSHATGEESVVFGRLVTGRNAAFAGIEEIVGPCINFIPVRARISSQQSPAQLLTSIQEQSISVGEADSLGLRDIIRHCTNWPAESQFDSIVMHQGVDEHPMVQSRNFSTRLQHFANPHRVPPCLNVISYREGNLVKLRLEANNHIMTRENLDMLLIGMREGVVKLLTDLGLPSNA